MLKSLELKSAIRAHFTVAGVVILSMSMSGASSAQTLCPDGTFVGGTSCVLAPDGSYVGGTPQLAPDGTYVSGQPQLAPDGSYVGGPPELAPDGSYVGGSPLLAPDGSYIANPRSPPSRDSFEDSFIDPLGNGYDEQ